MKRDILVLSTAILFASCGAGGGGSDNASSPDVVDHGGSGFDYGITPTDNGQANHPPVLGKIGDRVVAVGEPLVITLSATDADDDALSYSVYGDIPDGGKFDKASHTFQWVPLQTGKVVYLTFVVSDGSALDRETVEIKVVAEKTGHPPVFEKMSDQKVKAGAPVVLQLEAHDPDSDPLEFGISGTKPALASINPSTGEFTWTPAAEADKSVVTVTFVVSDGSYKDTLPVRFLVGDVQAGSPPAFDDVPAQQAKVGQLLSFRVAATDPDGGAVALAVDSGMPEDATFGTGTGEFRWTPTKADAGHGLSVTFSASDGQFTTYLTVKIVVEQASVVGDCKDDAYEPNNEPSAPKPLGAGTYDLSICDTELSPVDADYFALALEKGQKVTVRAEFVHAAGDIDTDLSLDGTEQTIVAISNNTGDVEEFSWEAVETRTYVLAVYGIANDTYKSPYKLTLAIEASSVCTDDSREENDDSDHAFVLPGDDANLADLVVCPGDEDWFSVALGKGDTVLAAANPKSGKVRLELVAPDTKTLLDSMGPGTGPATVGMDPVAETGVFFLRVSGAGAQAAYTLELVVYRAPAQCSATSCEAGKVCDATSGACVNEACSAGGTCPTGYSCVRDRCLVPCVAEGECRKGYGCKALDEGSFCGPAGTGTTGDACTTAFDCGLDRVCMFPEKGGYCAVPQCTSDMECPAEAWCLPSESAGWCALACEEAADCRTDAGFSCNESVTIDFMDITLCAPSNL